MENETVNQEESKTFTQDELNAIVGDRLKRERDKYADYEALKEKALRFDELEEASKTELQKATERAQQLEAELNGLKKAEELRTLKESVANEFGIPANVLSGSDEESLRNQAKAIKDYASQGNAYPQVKDGGEVANTKKSTTRQQFAEWWNNTAE